MQVYRNGNPSMSSRGPGVPYRLNIDIGASFTSASYQRAEESGVLRLSPFAHDLPSGEFVADSRGQVAWLAETLRSIAAAANQQLGEAPASVEVTYPASWDPRQLFLLWEALVLAGIPDAATQAVADPRPSVSAPRVEHEPSEAKAELVSQPAAPSAKRGWLVVAAIATIGVGVAAGVLATGGPRPASLPAGAESRPVSGAPTATQNAPSSIPTEVPDAPRGPGVELPASEALSPHQFVVPRGRNDATQLNLASVSGVVPARRLPSTIGGRNSWPVLSGDRRTIIYINSVVGSLRTRAVDGSGDRALIKPPKNCGQITRASWSPADQSIMVIECRAAGRPDRLLVIKLDGTVVRELRTGQPRIEDPTISPDGRTVAYWAHSSVGGPNGGSIYTLAIDGSSGPLRLTNRKAGSDADPAWSPDSSMIAFRRRGPNDNLNVYVMRSDGSGVRPVATGPAVDEKPAWSPDGGQLMIISNRDASGKPSERYDVYVLDLDGGKPQPLGLTANVVLTPVWSYR